MKDEVEVEGSQNVAYSPKQQDGFCDRLFSTFQKE